MNRLGNNLRVALSRIRAPWRIASQYRRDMGRLDQRVEEVHKRLGEHTVVHADIHYKDKDMVIVVGEYRKRAYVRCFYVDPGSFLELIKMLKQIEPHARVGRFDMSPGPPFSAVYERDRL